MNEENLIVYYNKFNEDKRLNTRHGQVEYLTAMKYIHEYLKDYDNPKILDVGAGTGKYSITLHNEGYDVTAVELVKHNLRVLEKNAPEIEAYQGNAIDLKRFSDESFDIVLLFGPMYHLISFKEKLKALKEAKRIVKKDGLIFISYCMNEYAIITHGFIENNIEESIKNNLVNQKFKITPNSDDLYSFVRLKDINKLNMGLGLKRIKIINQDGPAEYIKKTINNMDDKTFKLFMDYHFSTCELKELLGSGRHILDIIKK